MRRTSRIAVGLASLLLLTALAGCGVKKVRTVPAAEVLPLESATLPDLLERLTTQASEVHSINALTELEPSTGSAYSGVVEQYHGVRAFVLAQRESAESNAGEEIRMLGQAPIVHKDIFDMVANDREFRVFLPTKNKFIVGPAGLEHRSKSPIENLRPQHLLQAIFFRAPQPGAAHFLEENQFEGRRYYGVSEVIENAQGKPELARRWWFDRTDLSLVRVQHFGPGGKLQADVQYGDWRTANGVSYPYHIELARPQEDYHLALTIKEVTFNQPIAPEKFQLEPPPGVERVVLTEKGAAEKPADASNPPEQP